MPEVSLPAGRFDRLVDGLGALRERPYRLLFAATLTTSLGDAIGTIAVAFAVLDVAGAISLGIVIAARQIASAGVLIAGGVLSDRASRGGVRVVGPALGGVLVVATNPGWALAGDSASFLLCAVFLARIPIARHDRPGVEQFLAELRAVGESSACRAWLWSTVLIFGLGNVLFMFLQVLGPAVAKDRLGGAGAWAAILTAGGLGAIAGGVAVLHHRPSRPLVACVVWRWRSCLNSLPWPPAHRCGWSPPPRSAADSASRSTSRCGSPSCNERCRSTLSPACPPNGRYADIGRKVSRWPRDRGGLVGITAR